MAARGTRPRVSWMVLLWFPPGVGRRAGRLFLEVLALRPAKPRAVLAGGDEGLDHLRADEVAVELVQLREPKTVPVEVRVGRAVRGSPQVAEVHHQAQRRV